MLWDTTETRATAVHVLQNYMRQVLLQGLLGYHREQHDDNNKPRGFSTAHTYIRVLHTRYIRWWRYLSNLSLKSIGHIQYFRLVASPLIKFDSAHQFSHTCSGVVRYRAYDLAVSMTGWNQKLCIGHSGTLQTPSLYADSKVLQTRLHEYCSWGRRTCKDHEAYRDWSWAPYIHGKYQTPQYILLHTESRFISSRKLTLLAGVWPSRRCFLYDHRKARISVTSTNLDGVPTASRFGAISGRTPEHWNRTYWVKLQYISQIPSWTDVRG